ncbi:MAG: hypothetical protein KBF64_02300 [Anaerolineaceae bacterium]|nr:hypothetical protein [Anaerolineaceae bacterium]
MKGLSILLVISLLLSLAGCNFPLTRENRQLAQQSLTALSEDGGATAEPVGGFDPLAIDCLVGTWEVDSASMIYAGNMLIGGDVPLTFTNISPHIYFRFLWDEPLLGSTYSMQVWYVDTTINAVYTAGDSEHLMELTLNGSTTAYFSAGAAAGSFDYQIDPERTTLKVSSVKLDGLPLPAGSIPLADLIASIPSSTMYYTCESADVITLRDQNAVEYVTLNRVSDDLIVP